MNTGMSVCVCVRERDIERERERDLCICGPMSACMPHFLGDGIAKVTRDPGAHEVTPPSPRRGTLEPVSSPRPLWTPSDDSGDRLLPQALSGRVTICRQVPTTKGDTALGGLTGQAYSPREQGLARDAFTGPARPRPLSSSPAADVPFKQRTFHTCSSNSSTHSPHRLPSN